MLLIFVICLLSVLMSSLGGIFYMLSRKNSNSNDTSLNITSNGSYLLIDGKPVQTNPKPDIPKPDVIKPNILTTTQMNEIYKNCGILNTLVAVPPVSANTQKLIDKYIRNVNFIQSINTPNIINFYNFDFVSNRLIANVDNVIKCGYINSVNTKIDDKNQIVLDVNFPDALLGQNITLTLESPSYIEGLINVNGVSGDVGADL